MEAELFKTIAHVAPPEQIPAGKWLTTLNALLKRDVQGGMDWLSQCKQALIKWSDRPQMEGTVAGAYLWDGTGETRLYLLFTDGQRQGGMKNLYAAVCAPSEGLPPSVPGRARFRAPAHPFRADRGLCDPPHHLCLFRRNSSGRVVLVMCAGRPTSPLAAAPAVRSLFVHSQIGNRR